MKSHGRYFDALRYHCFLFALIAMAACCEIISAQEITLTVEEPAGVNRISEAVTSGIPLPVGTQTQNWSLFDGTRQIPVQVTRLPGRTPWMLLDFQVDVPASGTKSLLLRGVPSSVSPNKPLVINEDAAQIIVITGPLKLLIKKNPFNLFESVWIDSNNDNNFANDEQLVSSTGDNILIVDASSGQTFSGTGILDKFVWEYKGLLRATLRVDGKYKNASGEFIAYTTRLTFHAGQRAVKIEHILRNSYRSNERHVKIKSATLKLGSGAVRQRAVTHRLFNWTNVRPTGVLFEISPPTMSISYVGDNVDVDQNGGWLLPDLTHYGLTLFVDFSQGLSAAEQTRRMNAARSPLFALAPSSWYSDYGELTTSKFGTIEDEKQAYKSWGWAWQANQETRLDHKPDYWLAWKDIHSDSESDDLWQHLIMYLRTRSRGYWDRAMAWARYDKWEYAYRTDGFEFAWNTAYEHPKVDRPKISIPLTADDDAYLKNDYNVGKVDVWWSACHLWGWGLVDYYYLTGDYEALAAAIDIAEVSKRILGYWQPGPYQSFGHGYNVFDLGVRQESRHLLTITRLYEATQDPQWRDYMDHIAQLFLKSNGWDDRGMYVWQIEDYPKAFSGYHFGMLNHAFYRYYQVTANAEVRKRLLQMASFAKNSSMHPTWKYSGYRIALDYPKTGDLWHVTLDDGGYSGFTPLSSIVFIDALTRGYWLTGDITYLDRAKFHWDRGSKTVYGNPQARTAGDKQVGHFMNGQFNDSYFANNGELPYAHLLFYDHRQVRTGVVQPNEERQYGYELYQNFPNPFNPKTTIRYTLPVEGRVVLSIYDIQGRLVTKLIDKVQPAGYYAWSWGEGIASGVYFCRLEAQGTNGNRIHYREQRKMLLMK